MLLDLKLGAGNGKYSFALFWIVSRLFRWLFLFEKHKIPRNRCLVASNSIEKPKKTKINIDTVQHHAIINPVSDNRNHYI
ncbi:hypothetical protein AB4Z50_26945 [Paenibacillus sp. 2TAB26]